MAGVGDKALFGRYWQAESPIHRLDPRTKLVLTIIFIVAIFIVSHLAGYILILGFIWGTAKLAEIPEHT